MTRGIYTRRGGMDVQPAPWQCDDVHAYVFYLQGKLPQLQALCDRCINNPSGQKLSYKPASPFVVLTFQTLEGLRSLDPDHAGRYSYNEAAFWVMVTQGPGEGIELLIPYIFADNWMAVCAGREVYGYPKEVAQLHVPLAAEAPSMFSVRGLARHQPGRDEPARHDAEILRCNAVGFSADDAFDLFLGDELWHGLMGSALDAGSPLARMNDFVDLLLQDRLNFIFLRQMCAVTGGHHCDLQQIVRASADPFHVHSLWPLTTDFKLKLNGLASHPIAADLGLEADGGEVDVIMGIEFDLSFKLNEGVVAWPPPTPAPGP